MLWPIFYFEKYFFGHLSIVLHPIGFINNNRGEWQKVFPIKETFGCKINTVVKVSLWVNTVCSFSIFNIGLETSIMSQVSNF